MGHLCIGVIDSCCKIDVSAQWDARIDTFCCIILGGSDLGRSGI